mgnify:CR=1 FL=1
MCTSSKKYISPFAFRETPDEVEIIKVVGPKNIVKSKNVVVNLKSAASVNHEPSPHQQPQNVNKNLPNYQNQASTPMQANSMENNPAFKSNAAQFVYQVEFSEKMSCDESAIFSQILHILPILHKINFSNYFLKISPKIRYFAF